jgi:hypothetical protein
MERQRRHDDQSELRQKLEDIIRYHQTIIAWVHHMVIKLLCFVVLLRHTKNACLWNLKINVRTWTSADHTFSFTALHVVFTSVDKIVYS